MRECEALLLLPLLLWNLTGHSVRSGTLKGPGDGEAEISGFLGKGNRAARVKLSRTPIYAKSWIPTGFQASAKIWITNLQNLLLSIFLPNGAHNFQWARDTVCSPIEGGRSRLKRSLIPTRHANSLLRRLWKGTLGRWLKPTLTFLTILQGTCPVSATWVSGSLKRFSFPKFSLKQEG